jgi:prepilin-type N-terminal cleavage/methylation domain-containing protein
MSSFLTGRRRGFTLVELLVVMSIIGILVAILLPAIFVVRRTINNGRIVLELSNLDQAITEYKQNAGNDAPPNFNDQTVVQRHLAKRFPRMSLADVNAVKALVGKIDPSEVLPFWLGVPNKITGLGMRNNPVQPYNTAGEVKKFFEFDQSRLTDIDGDGWMEYSSPYSQKAPYVYFDFRSYAAYYAAPYSVPAIDGLARGTAKPYVNTSPPTLATHFVNAESYQIISAGQDGIFGTGGQLIPDGPHPSPERDNIANFSEGKTLQDLVP